MITRLLPKIVVCLLVVLSAESVHAYGETPDEAAQRARSLLIDPQTFGVGTFSTMYKDDNSIEALRGAVASGPEYFAACFNDGDLLMLAMPVSQNWRNALETKGRNATMSIMSSADPRIPDPRHTASHNPAAWNPQRPGWRRGMPSKQRLSLLGHIERIEADDADLPAMRACYLRSHPDASHWTPGSQESPHVAFWARFIVDHVYRVGGFGDESAIGWIDIDKYRRAGRRLHGQWSSSQRQPEEPRERANVGVLFGQDNDQGAASTNVPSFRIQA